jgi:putative phosphoesterase
MRPVSKARSVGIISDTHGLLRPEALHALGGSDLILHAGDIGSEDVLERLCQIAPVIAVRGNVDTAVWAAELPVIAQTEVGGRRIGILHDLTQLDIRSMGDDIAMIIYGHSHKPVQQTKEGIIYLNPGSAGPRRFRLPVSLVRADFGVKPPAVRFIDLLTGKDFAP